MNRVSVAATRALLVAVALAYTDYTGYSGAPGSGGTCAGTCLVVLQASGERLVRKLVLK